ncbi:MAG: PmeII family type II restriction endonuclease [Alphaproteobacteria bacterium]|nr:PmeII family type II restriction endonuclease [Alphaproteobacteria bacterium]
MNPLIFSEVETYILSHINAEFHKKKIDKLSSLNLEQILKRKNPYLFRAKGCQSAHDLIKPIMDATLSSGEETSFGNFLEGLAIFIAGKVYGGRKSGIKGIDLEFEDQNQKFLVAIKSGPNWGNSGQIENLVRNFKTAQKILSTSGGTRDMTIIFVEGCCYGVETLSHKGTHRKLCGQAFWTLISGGRDDLYLELIKPLGDQAFEQMQILEQLYNQRLNGLTAEFIARFCHDGLIDWERLLSFNSGIRHRSGGLPRSDDQ